MILIRFNVLVSLQVYMYLRKSFMHLKLQGNPF